MNNILKVILIFTIIIYLPSCGDDSEMNSDESSDPIETRFIAITVDEEIVMRDSQTGLEWVNGLEFGSSKPETGCNPLPPGLAAVDVIDQAQDFCEMLNFSGFDDWRVATSMELQKYTLDINTAGTIPFYQVSFCPRVIAIDSEDAVDTVTTINTHNTPPIGEINIWESKNGGVRCVRISSSS